MDGKQIVKSESKAYGYNYASLADIVNQGFKLPIMETRNIDGETFMGWLDEPILDKDGKIIKEATWHQGAPLIVPEMKGMNAAQAMGSALTYARRYTAQMALGLACDDDTKLEKTKGAPEPTGKVYGNKVANAVKNQPSGGGNKVDFDKVRLEVKKINDLGSLAGYWDSLNLSEKQKQILRADFNKRREEIKGGGK